MIKHTTLIFLVFFCNIAKSEIIFTQPDKLPGNANGYNGNTIQLNIEFTQYAKPITEITIHIDKEEAIRIQNYNSNHLQRFATRLRMQAGESISVTTKSDGFENSTSFKPTIASDYTNPNKDEFNPQVRAVKADSEALKKFYGTEKGDCAFLLLGVSNTQIIPKSYDIHHDDGKIIINGSKRLSQNPLFSIGLSKEFEKCQIQINQ